MEKQQRVMVTSDTSLMPKPYEPPAIVEEENFDTLTLGCVGMQPGNCSVDPMT